MKYIFLYPLLLFASRAFTQDCSKALLREKPGTWKTNQQGSIVNVKAADLTKEKSVIAAIHKMVQTNYFPKGCQVAYSTVYGKNPGEGQHFIADPYHYSMYILRFLCDGNSKDKSKFYVDYSTPTTVNITANVIYSLNNLYAANLAVDDFRGYLKLNKRPQKKDGVWFMGEEIVGDRGTPYEIREYRWLITYNDTLPFSYVSQKEYLLLQKKRLEKDLVDNPSEKDYTYKFINKINDYLKRPDAELSQPAVCMWNDEQRFEKFVEEGTNGSFIAIKPNLEYYHKKLAPSAPQFFSVVYKIAAGDEVFEYNIDHIKKAVNFSTLKNLLGK